MRLIDVSLIVLSRHSFSEMEALILTKPVDIKTTVSKCFQRITSLKQ
jgi:hypothetical protein